MRRYQDDIGSFPYQAPAVFRLQRFIESIQISNKLIVTSSHRYSETTVNLKPYSVEWFVILVHLRLSEHLLNCDRIFNIFLFLSFQIIKGRVQVLVDVNQKVSIIFHSRQVSLKTFYLPTIHGNTLIGIPEFFRDGKSYDFARLRYCERLKKRYHWLPELKCIYLWVILNRPSFPPTIS